MAKSLLLMFLLLLLPSLQVFGTPVCVSPNGVSDKKLPNPLCGEQIPVIEGLDNGVQLMNQSNTQLLLLPGNHTLSVFTIVESVSNVSIVGIGTRETVELTCEENVGLAFVNVSNLVIHKITITNCGIRNENMVAVSERAQEYVLLNHTYALYPSIRRAVFMAECHDLSLQHVRIRNTVGVGLTALNVLGNSHVQYVEFCNNSGPYSDSLTRHDLSANVSGSAMFYFGNSLKQDTHTSETKHNIVIDSCQFKSSTSSALATRHILVDDFFEISDFRDDHNGIYPLDGASGLSLIFSRNQGDLHHITVRNSQLVGNSHPDGGCMLILFQQLASNASVLLDTVRFDDCRGGQTGGGLLVGYGYPTKFAFQEFESAIYQSVNVRNSEFYKCRGNFGGGSAVLSIPNFIHQSNQIKEINFENCTWTKNLGSAGCAAAFWEGKYHGVQKRFGININFTDCTFIENRIEFENQPQLNAAAINLDAVAVSFKGETYFGDNRISCIGATRSEVQVFDNFLAERSQVVFGGVLDFRDTSFLIVKDGATVTFAENRALWRGGAVSENTFAPWPLTEFGICFLHFENFRACPVRPCYNLSDYNKTEGPPSRVVFRNNSASLFGNEIFGPTFQFCPWLNRSISNDGAAILSYLDTHLSDVIDFGERLTAEHNVVNSYLNDVSFDPATPLPSTVMPGELFRATVTALDFFNQPVPAVSTLRRIRADGLLDASGRFTVDGNLVTFIEGVENLRFIFKGEPGENVTFQFLPISLFQPIGRFTFTLSECNAGFIYNHDKEECVCDPLLENLHESIRCQSNGSISHGPLRWIGYQDIIRDGVEDVEYVTSLCVYDYCEETNLINDLSDFSEQCKHDRTGDLCGGCKEGLSRVLGSSACKDCSNTTLLYILLYIASGLLIVLAIFVFQISISHGYLNGPILYANILSTFATILFPLNRSRYTNAAFVLISFLNLDIGFESCFYDGMTQTHYTALRLTYPFYLLLIIGCIVLFVKMCPKSRLLQSDSFHPIGAIATVMFLSFNNLLQTVSEILAVAVLDFRGRYQNHSEVRWLVDPTIRYAHGTHGLLVFIAWLLLLVILLPLVTVLLLYKPLQKVKYIGKFLQKRWPFFDAFQNPYVKRFRFWIGIQLLLRVASLVTSGISQLTSKSLNGSFRYFSLFLMIMLLATFTGIEAFLRPFRGTLRNAIDIIFLLDLLYVLLSALYYNLVRLSVQANPDDISLIMTTHYVTIEVLLNIAIFLIGFIFIGFVCVRCGLVRIIDKRLIPKLRPNLRVLVAAILEDAGYKVKTPIAKQTPSRKKSTAKTGSVLTTPTHTTVAPDWETSSELDREHGLELQEVGQDDPQNTDEEEIEFETQYSRYRDSILEHTIASTGF